MSTKYLIFTQRDFAHRQSKPDKYVCYRTVIAHALLNKIKKSSLDKAEQAFQDFKKAFEHSEKFEDPDFVLFYPIPMKEGDGFLLIDKSDGYYPLVIYPFKKNSNASRRSALSNVLDDINNNIDKLLKLINNKEWTSDLQLNMQDNLFHYSEDENNLSKAA